MTPIPLGRSLTPDGASQCQHAALIGDHKQLPPLVISAKAEEGHLQTSLFERLIKTGSMSPFETIPYG